MILKISLYILFMNSLALANRSYVLLGAVEQSRLVMWPGASMSTAETVCSLTESAMHGIRYYSATKTERCFVEELARRAWEEREDERVEL